MSRRSLDEAGRELQRTRSLVPPKPTVAPARLPIMGGTTPSGGHCSIPTRATAQRAREGAGVPSMPSGTSASRAAAQREMELAVAKARAAKLEARNAELEELHATMSAKLKTQDVELIKLHEMMSDVSAAVGGQARTLAELEATAELSPSVPDVPETLESVGMPAASSNGAGVANGVVGSDGISASAAAELSDAARVIATLRDELGSVVDIWRWNPTSC